MMMADQRPMRARHSGTFTRLPRHSPIVMGISLALLGMPAWAQFACVDSSGTAQQASASYATDTACGQDAVANGAGPQTGWATAFGAGATAGYSGATAIGAHATAVYDNDVAIGDGAHADSSPAGGGAGAIAIGTAMAQGTASVAIGGNASAWGDLSVALGNASANGNGAVAIGGATANADKATALGFLAEAFDPFDVALGASSTTEAPHTGTTGAYGVTATGRSMGVVSVGAAGGLNPLQRQIQNVAPGVIGSTSTDAINGSQLFAVTQGIDNVGASTVRALGGSAVYNLSDGTIANTAFAIQGSPYTSVSDAFSAVDTSITSTHTQIMDLTSGIEEGSIGLVQQLGGAPGQGALTLGALTGGNVLNVGGTDGTRRLTGLSPGAVSANSSDAVTGAQLYAATQASGAGWTLATSATGTGQVSGTTSQSVAAGGTVTLIAGNNMTITQNGAQVTVATSTTPIFDTVTTSGLAVTPGASVDMGGNVIHNVAPGVAATDAATVGQVDAAISAGGANAVQYDSPSHGSVTLNPGGPPAALHNIATGTVSANSTDAVNGSQLYATNQTLTQVQSVANGALTTVNNVVAGHAGLVQTDGSTITVGKADAATRIDMSGASGPRMLTGLAPGVAENDAATVSQLWNDSQQTLSQANAYTDQQFNILDRRLNALGAAAMAASSLTPNARGDGRFQLAAAVGTYGDATALAVGANYWVTNNVLLNAHVSRGVGDGARTGMSIGATFGF